MGTCSSEEKKEKKSSFRSSKNFSSYKHRCYQSHLKNKIEEIFDKYDTDQDGFLDREEAIELLKEGASNKPRKNSGGSV